jgi:prophage endopeptidase
MTTLRALLALAIAAALAYALHLAYQHGKATGQAEVTLKWQNERLDIAKATERDFDKLIARTNTLADQLHTQETRNYEEKAHAKAEIDHLRTAVRAGTVRLSVRTTGTACPRSPDTQSTAATTEPETTRTELDPATSEALVTITDDGDSGIRDLNACIERYNTVAKSINTAATTSSVAKPD